MHVMYDDTDLKLIPKQPHAVAAYINGNFANFDEARRLFPHARLLGISVNGIVPADCYDIERGDYSPEQVPELYKVAVEHGIWRPCFYAQLSGVMPAVIEQLNKVIQARKDVRLWVAYYNGSTDLPSRYDAHQFTDKALGRSLDESICADDFFRPAPKPAPEPPVSPPKPTDRVNVAKVTFDADSGEWAIKGEPGEFALEIA